MVSMFLYMTGEHEAAHEQLKDRLAPITDLSSTKSLLFSNQQTYMPRGAVGGPG